MISNPFSAGILILISCWNHCVYGVYVLYWGLTYAWVCFHLTYVRRHNVSVFVGSGRYIVVSEPRFTPGVGNHLGQYSSSYQQYKQIQIQTCLYLNLGFQRRVQEYTVIDTSFLDSFVVLTYSCQPDFLISFSLSFHLIASNPLGLLHYNNSPSWLPYRYQSAQRKCCRLVPFSLWGLSILFSYLIWNFEDEIFCKVGRNVTPWSLMYVSQYQYAIRRIMLIWLF